MVSGAFGPIDGRGANGVALLVAHQREAARQHRAVGQRGQQLAAMGDAGVEPLQRGDKRAPRPLRKAVGALAFASDGLALGLGVGELRGLQPRFQPHIALAAASQQRPRRQRQPLARHQQPVPRLRDLAAQHAQGQARADAREAAEMRVRIGFEAARQVRRGRIEPLPRHGEHLARRGQRARGRAQLVAAVVLAALPADKRAAGQAFDLDQQARCAPAPPFRPPRSASARACRRRNRSA